MFNLAALLLVFFKKNISQHIVLMKYENVPDPALRLSHLRYKIPYEQQPLLTGQC